MVASRVPCDSDIPARLWPVLQMSDPNHPDDVTSGSNVPNTPDAGCQGPQTRQQSAAHGMVGADAAAAIAQAAATRARAAS